MHLRNTQMAESSTTWAYPHLDAAKVNEPFNKCCKLMQKKMETLYMYVSCKVTYISRAVFPALISMTFTWLLEFPPAILIHTDQG